MNKGFSLAELLVVVAIFLILTSVVLINQNRFSSDTNITNLAYQVALSIREAQIYGISVRGTQFAPNKFDTAYGIHFDLASTTSYFLFPDLNKDGIYNPSTEIPLTTYKIENGVTLSSINIRPPEAKLITSADITFKRPNPEALITTNATAGFKEEIDLIFKSALGDKFSTTTVTQSGQIYVK
jgi:prepilin-type N-terminal cleavage/methylation domain-containing protein